MRTVVSPESAVNNDARVGDDERSLYRLLGYFLVAWILLWEAGRRLFPEYVGPSVTASVVTLGSWFVVGSRRSKFSLVQWVGISVASGLAAAGLVYLLNFFWPVV
jgi:hypothetical protein